MVKYNEETEKKAIKLFEQHTLVTSDTLANLELTPSIILNHLMNKGLISRCRDPLCYHRYLYFLTSKNVEEELKERQKQSLTNKRKELQNRIAKLERAKAYHIELIKRHDQELTNLREELKFFTSPEETVV